MKLFSTLSYVPLSVSALLVGACISPPVEAPKTTVEQQTSVSADQNIKDKVDLLFMIDDSGSMGPKQTRLRAAFPQLISVLNDFGKTAPASYHIGVVTSDLGAANANCGSSKGAKLQAKGAAATNCSGPTSGNFLIYDQKVPSNSNLPTGQDLAQTFTCMASVGEKGCGFEHQLESVYRALHDQIPENNGFLRPDAILAVIFVTDEDDCSADVSSTDIFSGPDTTYGPGNSYRCTRYGITCDGQFPLPATPQATFASCSPATLAQGSKFADINKYINFFTKSKSQGGIKENPRDVVLAAIDASSTPFGTTTGTGAGVCGTASAAGCTVVGHSCNADAQFFGEPAVRLNAVLSKAQGSTQADICGGDDVYKTALNNIGKKIVAALKPSCITSPIRNLKNPDCSVESITTVNGDDIHKSIPFCDKVAGQTPCYVIDQNVTDCGKVCNPDDGAYQQIGVRVVWGATGATAPANTTANISCATIAIANEDPNAKCGAM